MIVYLSGIQKEYFEFISQFKNFGVLASFVEKKLYFEYQAYGFKNIMFDSGAFSVSTGKAKIDIDTYIEFLKEHDIKCAVNLDVIGDGEQSLKNWDYINSKGVNTIPVYHLDTDINYLHKYAENTDYVGLSPKTRYTQSFLKQSLDKAFYVYPHHKFHLFGCTCIPVMKQYPIYSCDSTSWMNGTRMGWVITRHGNYFLNNKKNVPVDVEKFLKSEYGLGNINDYDSVISFGTEINKVSIRELDYIASNFEPILKNRTVTINLF